MPETQSQEVVYFRPDVDGSIAIYGTGGAGKSVALRTLAAAAGITPRGGPVEVYGLDFGSGGLRMLETLPHVGSIISGDDGERIVRLFKTLKTKLDERSNKYADVNAGTVSEYRELAGAPDEARILLLVDGFPAFRDQYDTMGANAQAYGVFQQIVSDGRNLGIHVAITADRGASVPTSISSNIQSRLVLRLADENAYAMVDAPTDVLSATSPPGRAIYNDSELQVAVLGGTSNVSEQQRATQRLADLMIAANRSKAGPVGSLPTVVGLSTLPVSIDGRPLLGISDDQLAPIGLEPAGIFLLSGPPASGRTNGLLALGRSLRRWSPDAPLHYFGTKRSVVGKDGIWTTKALTPEDVAEAAAALRAEIEGNPDAPWTGIVVEGIGDFLSTPAEGPLTELVKAVKRSDHLLIAENETTGWNSSWSPLSDIKSVRRGLLLQPEGIDGDTVLRTTLPRSSRTEFPPGRGFLVEGGNAIRLHLPLAD